MNITIINKIRDSKPEDNESAKEPDEFFEFGKLPPRFIIHSAPTLQYGRGQYVRPRIL